MATKTPYPTIPWTPYAQATHLIVGYGAEASGVLATAPNELTAYRYRRLLLPHHPDAKVVANTPENLNQVHDQIRAQMEAL